MHATRKGQPWSNGMKLHIRIDPQTGLIHHLTTTPAQVQDISMAPLLLHGAETDVGGMRPTWARQTACGRWLDIGIFLGGNRWRHRDRWARPAWGRAKGGGGDCPRPLRSGMLQRGRSACLAALCGGPRRPECGESDADPAQRARVGSGAAGVHSRQARAEVGTGCRSQPHAGPQIAAQPRHPLLQEAVAARGQRRLVGRVHTQSNCVGCQVSSKGKWSSIQGFRALIMALRIVSSLRMAAMRATFLGLPTAHRRR